MLDRSASAASDPASPLVTSGDGRIEATRADPPAGVPVLCRDESDASHSGVATDLEKVVPLLAQLSAEAARRAKAAPEPAVG